LEGFTLIPSVNSNFEDEEKYRALVRWKWFGTTKFVEQDSQSTYNVTLMRVLATAVAVENKLILHILNVCLYP
jgi:hypothetical protein